MLIQPINWRFRKEKLQQSRDQLQQQTLVGIGEFFIDFIGIGRVLSINRSKLFPPAVKTQIREGGKSGNMANEENSL